MRKQDEEDIGVLKEILARRLDEDLGYDDDADADEDEDEDDDELPAQVDAAHDAAHGPVGTSPAPPSRRGDATASVIR